MGRARIRALSAPQPVCDISDSDAVFNMLLKAKKSVKPTCSRRSARPMEVPALVLWPSADTVGGLRKVHLYAYTNSCRNSATPVTGSLHA